MIRSGNLKSLNQLINMTMMGSGNKAGGQVEERLYLNVICPFPSAPLGNVMEDIAQIVVSMFGQSSRLSFMYPFRTLISVMLTKKTSGASRANPQRVVIVTDEHGVEQLHLASQASTRPSVIY